LTVHIPAGNEAVAAVINLSVTVAGIVPGIAGFEVLTGVMLEAGLNQRMKKSPAPLPFVAVML